MLSLEYICRYFIKKKFILIALVILFLIIPLIFGVFKLISKRKHQELMGIGKVVEETAVKSVHSTDDAFIMKLFVKNNQKVKKGQIIAVLKINQNKLSNLPYSKINSTQKFDLLSALPPRKIPTLPSINILPVLPDSNIKLPNDPDFDVTNSVSSGEYQAELKKKQQKEAQLMLVSKQATKYKELYDEGVISKQEFSQLETAYVAKQKEFNDIVLHLSKMKQELSHKKAPLVSFSGNNVKIPQVLNSPKIVNRTTKIDVQLKKDLKASCDGIIQINEKYKKGYHLKNNETLLNILPEHPSFIAEVKVEGENLELIHLLQKVKLKIDNVNEIFYGEVIAINPLKSSNSKLAYDVKIRFNENSVQNKEGVIFTLKPNLKVFADFYYKKHLF